MLNRTKLLIAGILANFEETYRAMLQRPYLAQINALFTEISSNKATETYAWLGEIPRVKEWLGAKVFSDLKSYAYTIVNKDWYAGFAVHKNEMEDEQIDAVTPRISMNAMVLADHKLELIADLIKNGTTNLAFDGVAFFASSGRAMGSNLLTGTGVTYAQLQTDISTARAAAMRFKDANTDDPKNLGIIMDTVVVPPELERVFMELVGSTSVIVDGKGSNVNPISSFIKNVIVLPELSDANDWYMLCTTYPLKPFIYQNRKEVEPVVDETKLKSMGVYEFSAETRGDAGYGFPQLALKVTN